MTAVEAGNGLWTVGHSNHTAEHFAKLLARHDISAVADVRSQPYSFWTVHFNRGQIKAALAELGIPYVFLGEELGGRPPESHMYDAQGHVLYGDLSQTSRFKRGMERLLEGSSRFRVAVMCSEENPERCHRRLLVVRALLEQAPTMRVTHIRGDGSADAEPSKGIGPLDAEERLGFFAESEVQDWRSAAPVTQPMARQAG